MRCSSARTLKALVGCARSVLIATAVAVAWPTATAQSQPYAPSHFEWQNSREHDVLDMSLGQPVAPRLGQIVIRLKYRRVGTTTDRFEYDGVKQVQALFRRPVPKLVFGNKPDATAYGTNGSGAERQFGLNIAGQQAVLWTPALSLLTSSIETEPTFVAGRVQSFTWTVEGDIFYEVPRGVSAGWHFIALTGFEPGPSHHPFADHAWWTSGQLQPLFVENAEYVALGDSYASGEGAPPFPGTDAKNNHCHRSDRPGSLWFAQAPGPDMEVLKHTNVACSGAVLDDLSRINQGEPVQLDSLSARTLVVSVSIGGNDAYFAKVLTSCVLDTSACVDTWKKRVKKRLKGLRSRLPRLYSEIHRRAPNARLLVVGYPHLFNKQPKKKTRRSCKGIDPLAQTWINRVVDDANSMVSNLVEDAPQANKAFVDLRSAFAGHGVCAKHNWINGIRVGKNTKVLSQSFHPNVSGQRAIGKALAEEWTRMFYGPYISGWWPFQSHEGPVTP